MPLEFLKKRGNADAQSTPAKPAKQSGQSMPEEIVAQDHQLKLYYAGKSSEGVRMKSGPKALAELPGMLAGLAQLGDRGGRSAADRIQPGDAHDLPPVRGDAVAQRPPRQLADHPARARRARVDRRGRPGVRHVRLRPARRRGRHVRLPRVQRDRRRRGVALGRGDGRHDLPRGRRLGRPRRPRRHRPDRGEAPRRAARRTSWRASTRRAWPRSSDPCRRPVGAASCAPTAASRRRTSGPSTARSAACACSAADRATPPMPLYDYDCAHCGRRIEVIHGVYAPGPDRLPLLRRRARSARRSRAPAVHFKGSGWAKKERRAAP